MTLHERHEPTAIANCEFNTALAEIIGKHKLSYGELFAMLSSAMAQWAKYLVRDERSEENEATKQNC